MKWFLIYTAMLFGLWHAIDLEGDTVLQSAVAPLAFAFVLIACLVWLAGKIIKHPSSSSGDAGGVGTGGFFGGGDSCGGGGDGGGGC
ncbi:hypothetical protein [Marinobacter mobilis]|uniref:hypothetical protein n=1 Tax=Marinobacter mobilis TaxID=488533 RepID=UPI0035C76F9A